MNKLNFVTAGRLLGFSNRGTKAKSITSCDNAFVTNIVLLALRYTTVSCKKHLLPRHPQGALVCAKRQQMFYLCESVATATRKRLAGTEISPCYGVQQNIKAHFSNNRIGEMSLSLLKRVLSGGALTFASGSPVHLSSILLIDNLVLLILIPLQQ